MHIWNRSRVRWSAVAAWPVATRKDNVMMFETRLSVKFHTCATSHSSTSHVLDHVLTCCLLLVDGWVHITCYLSLHCSKVPLSATGYSAALLVDFSGRIRMHCIVLHRDGCLISWLFHDTTLKDCFIRSPHGSKMPFTARYHAAAFSCQLHRHNRMYAL